MKVFFQGSFFGLAFSSLAIWVIKFSPWAFLPELKLTVFLLGGILLGGFINLLMGNFQNVSTK